MIYTLLWMLITVASVILVHIIGNNMPNMLMIFLSTTYAIIFFHIINWNKVVRTYKILFQDGKLIYFKLSLSILVVWFGTFLIPIYFNPSYLLITYTGITSACGALSLYLTKKKLASLITTIVLLLNLIGFYIFTGTKHHLWLNLIFILSTIVTGLAGYMYARVSVTLAKYEFSSTQILAVRFWILWLISLILVLYTHQFSQIEVYMLPHTLLVAFISLIIPIYFAQKSYEKFGADKSVMLFAFTPFIAALVEPIFIKSEFNYGGVVFATTTGIIIASSFVHKIITKSK